MLLWVDWRCRKPLSNSVMIYKAWHEEFSLVLLLLGMRLLEGHGRLVKV
jgi:hypothetical protein